MYSRQEASKLRQEFWTRFGHYVAPLPSADGLKINWINYKTGFDDVTFKMDVANNHAFIGIVLSHGDEDIRELYFEQFRQLAHLLHEEVAEQWIWELNARDHDGKMTSRIYMQLDNVTIFRREDWAQLISFFKLRIIALDRFWDTAKYAFESLR